MSLYQLKPWFRQKLSSITHYLWLKGVTPNQVTVLAMTLSVLYGISMFFIPLLFSLFPLFVLFRMALNAIDGLMATTYHMKSDLGQALNEVGDLISDFFLFLPFVMFVPIYLMILFILGAILTELVGMAGLSLKNERFYHGPLGKSDRVFVFSFLSLFIYFNGAIPFVTFVFIVLNFLLVKTIFNRFKANL